MHRRGLTCGTVGLAQPAPRAVALHRTTNLASDSKARATRAFTRTPEDDQRRSLDSFALLKERLELGAAGEPFGTAEPPFYPVYTVSRFRPFARRRFKTFRPPLVFIRARKPWVFFRRRTFG